jgi:nitroreductase
MVIRLQNDHIDCRVTDFRLFDPMTALADGGLSDLSHLVRSRRTSLRLDRDRPVPLQLVHDLCELAQWAPNHKRTWPWRFALFVGEGRARLGEAFAADLSNAAAADTALDHVRAEKARHKYLRAPAVLLVGSAGHPEQVIHRENAYAVAAGIQNLLLGATVAGLASHWASPPVQHAPRAIQLAGFADDTELVGVVYLGWPTDLVESPERPPLQLNVVAD